MLCRLISPTLSIVWKNGNELRGFENIQSRARNVENGGGDSGRVTEGRGFPWKSAETRQNARFLVCFRGLIPLEGWVWGARWDGYMYAKYAYGGPAHTHGTYEHLMFISMPMKATRQSVIKEVLIHWSQ